MTELKEVKGTVLCENFNEKFSDFVMKSGNLKNVFCSTYKNESGFYLSDYMDLLKRSKVEIVKYINLSESTFKKLFFRLNVLDGSNSYFFDINIYLNCEIFLHIVNNDNTLDSYILRFREEAFNSFFNFIQAEEENASEPEQPAEDAEAKANPELIPAEENKQDVELTSLERILFEEHQKCLSSSISYLDKAHEAESEDEHDMYLSDASSATLIFEYISKIINQACLAGKYSAWLQERKEQKAVGASK